MKKTIYEQRNGTYCRQGNYLLPNLAVPENVPIGMWGQRHLRYIKEHRKGIYTGLQLSGKLNDYLADIDRQAQEQMDILIRQMAQTQGIAEELKTTDQLAWAGAMNNIRAAAKEIVNQEIIFG